MTHEVRAQVLIRKWLENPRDTSVNRAHLQELAIAIRDALTEVDRASRVGTLQMVWEHDSWIAKQIIKDTDITVEEIRS